MQLANGTSARLGRVEVLINGFWKSICASGFDENAGNVVCRMLGLNTWYIHIISIYENRNFESHPTRLVRKNSTTVRWP